MAIIKGGGARLGTLGGDQIVRGQETLERQERDWMKGGHRQSPREKPGKRLDSGKEVCSFPNSRK